MKLVIVESPFAHPEPVEHQHHLNYARRAVSDAVHRGEAPIASHLLLTQPGILDDSVPDERALGIAVGLEWYRAAQVCAVYVDRGISKGMITGIQRAKDHHVFIDYRSINGRGLAEIVSIVARGISWPGDF